MNIYTVTVMLAVLVTAADARAQNQTGVQGSATAGAQTSASTENAQQADASVAGGLELNATLSKSVDASKAKPGDAVTATAAQDVKSAGQVVIPKGSKLIGHVTKAQARTKSGSSASGSAAGSVDSQLGIVFDSAVLKDGREVPLNATVQALAVARTAASAGSSSLDTGTSAAGSAAASGSSTGGGLVGGVTGTAAGTVGTVAGASGALSSTVGGTVSKSVGATGGLNTAGRLTAGSKGVFGLHGLSLTSAAAGSVEGSVITSTSRNVRLDSGTQMLLTTSASAASGAGAASAPAAATSNVSGAANTATSASGTGAASGPAAAGSVSGAAEAAGGVSGAVKPTGDSGAAQKPKRPDDNR